VTLHFVVEKKLTSCNKASTIRINIFVTLKNILEIFFKKLIPSYLVRMSLDGIALLGLVATMIYDYYIKRNFRKTKIG